MGCDEFFLAKELLGGDNEDERVQWEGEAG